MLEQPPLNVRPLAGHPQFQKAWISWFAKVWYALSPLTESGTTANRPVTGLYPGRFYFDTSLGSSGKPIWVNKTVSGWVDGSGASV